MDRLLSQKKDELRLLQDSIAQRNATLASALADGDADVSDKRRHIKVPAPCCPLSVPDFPSGSVPWHFGTNTLFLESFT